MKWQYKVLHIDAKGFLGSKVVDEIEFVHPACCADED